MSFRLRKQQEAPRPADPRVDLAYGAELRSLDLQAAGREALRTRAGTLFAVAALVATLLGGETLRSKGLHSWPVWVAIVSLAGSCLMTLLVLWPWRLWQDRLNGQWILMHWVYKESLSIDQIRDRLAEMASDEYRRNDKHVGLLERFYQAAAILVIVQIVAWLIAL